ncbi:hypothetical protein TUM3794_20380 [Shewanella colwelliana]|uniref:Uncharacterized protein n=1 Tax=Shewanella colwelliana TaxID=23 RepID=A0ABQ4P0P7_SHECO|nr:hypothetical protein [Shewanella colwelliana]GIU41010.1 hypothetical protein TUM3794_20380 [Shewanella colwelliana]
MTNLNPQIILAHKAAEHAAKESGFSCYADLNESNNETAKEAARAAFDNALAGSPVEA